MEVNTPNFTPKRKAMRSNRIGGAIISKKSSEKLKIFCFFHNIFGFDGRRFIPHFFVGRFIHHDLLIVVALLLKLNNIPSPSKILLIN